MPSAIKLTTKTTDRTFTGPDGSRILLYVDGRISQKSIVALDHLRQTAKTAEATYRDHYRRIVGDLEDGLEVQEGDRSVELCSRTTTSAQYKQAAIEALEELGLSKEQIETRLARYVSKKEKPAIRLDGKLL